MDDSQEQQVTDVEAELNETRQAIRVMLDFLEKDVDLTEASKKVSLPELF